MRRIVVLSTGGTIATRQDAHGTRLAADPADALLDRLPRPPGVPVETRDVFCLGSYLLTPADMREVAVAAHETLADESVRGVVVTHGTDSLEETAYLLDLFHADPRPVVFTGAMRPADAPDGDGPRNLADAIAVANAARARDLGVLISFDGRIYPARGTRKAHTVAPAAFAAPDGGPLGRVADGEVEITAAPLRPKPLDLAAFRPNEPESVRTDIVAVYPGCDIRALRAVADAGARAVVLEATGAGNANPQVAAEVARLVGSGVVVALSTRVHAGPVAAVYGNGGGADLVRAGAVPTGTLRPSQARVLLTALLGCYGDPARVRTALETALRTAVETAQETAQETSPERNQHG